MSDPTEFRLASVSDAANLAVMSRDLVELGLGWSWTQARIVRHIRSAESVVVVARSHGLITGFAIMRFGREEAHLDLLAVRPKYRRTGIGRRLMAWLEKSALVAGISVIYLEVRENRKEARAFYEKLGYRRVTRLPGYYRGQESAICMGRDLWCETSSAIS
ncbi:MAG TPA: ribosomal protein S18-alanine N-acetyltransferase [Gammaproteobacteria bacterium]|nr:ribosomal protein S18-alanine N-acetyltransferase [Gammaproteobacteria bacterium]